MEPAALQTHINTMQERAKQDSIEAQKLIDAAIAQLTAIIGKSSQDKPMGKG